MLKPRLEGWSGTPAPDTASRRPLRRAAAAARALGAATRTILRRSLDCNWAWLWLAYGTDRPWTRPDRDAWFFQSASAAGGIRLKVQYAALHAGLLGPGPLKALTYRLGSGVQQPQGRTASTGIAAAMVACQRLRATNPVLATATGARITAFVSACLPGRTRPCMRHAMHGLEQAERPWLPLYAERGLGHARSVSYACFPSAQPDCGRHQRGMTAMGPTCT